MAEVRVSRTHRRPLRTTAGFEDREGHRSPGTSIVEQRNLYNTERQSIQNAIAYR